MNLDQHKLQGVTKQDVRESREELTEEEKREYEEKILMEKYRELRFLERKIDIKNEFERDEEAIQKLEDRKQELKDEIEKFEYSV